MEQDTGNNTITCNTQLYNRKCYIREDNVTGYSVSVGYTAL